MLNTHRMVSNQVSLSQIYSFLRDEPPVLLDWLPWIIPSAVTIT